MTGRRLYDLFCDAHRSHRKWEYGEQQPAGMTQRLPLLAWPYLDANEHHMWNSMARRLRGVKR